MNILCIDTSSESVAITTKGSLGTFTCIYKPNNKRHASLLISSIELAVKNAGFDISQTEAIICPQGPGSFTGLRLAYSVAKALQLKTNANIYCVPTLEAINVAIAKQYEQSIAIIDAKRERFYTQVFNYGKQVTEPMDISALNALNLVNTDKKCIVCGFGTEQFKSDISNIENRNIENLFFIELKNENLSQIMLDYILSEYKPIEIKPYDGPLYIRKSDAEQ